MDIKVPTMAEMAANGQKPDVLFWVGCSGSFDQRAQRITRAFVKILNHLNIKYAVLGTEESCTGDPAKRAGNEFVYQMLAMQNIEVMNNYGVQEIVTTCPHCFNILKNEYPALGGKYRVRHHAQFLQELIDQGKIKLTDATTFKGKRITYHDSCYLGRANEIYEAPRKVLELLDAELVEMKSCKTKGLCCGAGGAQMFKEEEHGKLRINEARTLEALEVSPDIVASACPFCNTMLTDGVKGKDMQVSVKVFDIAELIAQGQGLDGF
ncbi:MAG: (Fe-S)-binding protein [Bacteroidetes bacterium]|nr:(Fe-S)-binding protein [Bacteroidota bacterium]MBS1686233.1 (Fe-S)-binding protein [Bacteroidota bacterium]